MNIFYPFLIGFILNQAVIGLPSNRYCQPGESCWPTDEEVEQFKSYLTPDDEQCHSLPTFSSLDEPGK